MTIPSITKTITYDIILDVELKGDFFTAKGKRKEKTIIYFHGGGLVYGSRNDLPHDYVNLFLENGYDFFAIDYPLYPETDIQNILNHCMSSIQWFLKNGIDVLGLKSTDYILFGRSSGGFITNYLTAFFSGKKPNKLISLYSYFDLNDYGLTGPNSHYIGISPIPSATVKRLIQSKPLSCGRLENRYMIYVYLRQKGLWFKGLENTHCDLTIPEECFEKFPPTFLSASTKDKDVPYSQSEKMNQLIKDSYLFTVDENIHDFDREYNSPVSKRLYEQIIKWLE